MVEEKKKTDYLPKSDEEGFFAFIEKQVKQHPVVKNYHGKWKELIAWTDLGEQYSEWKADEGAVASIKNRLKKRKKCVVINLMKPLEEALSGKINLIYLLAGSPSSSDIGDVEASKVSTKFLSHNDYINDIENLNEDFKYDLLRTGNGWFKWVFDRGGDGYIAKKEKDGTITPIKEEGEVIGSVPSAFNVRPDPTAKRRKDMRWFIELAEVSEEEILEKFNLEKEEFRAKVEEEGISGKYDGMNEPLEDKDREEKTYIVKYYWEKKSRKYPEGRYIICVGNYILWKGKNPALGEIPYFHVGFKRHGNSMWHTGPLHHIQPIQREFNRMVSIISEHLEGWRAKVIVPRGSILKEGAFTTDSFELLEVDTSKGEPRPANMPELSPQIMGWRDFLMGAIDKVSNVHEVSYSQLPQYASRAPASLYSMMLEQENIKIDPLVKRLNKAILEMGKFRLRLMEKYYTQPRMVSIVGKSQEATINYFRGADLKGNLDVKLEIGVSLNQPKVIQQRLLLEMKQQGAPIDWNKIYKLLGDGEISEELRGDIIDESRAIRENQTFINDTYKKPREEGGVFVLKDDNPEVHLSYHTNLLKTEEAQRWPEEKWQDFSSHIEEHRAIFLESQVEQPQPPGAPQGMPGGPGAGLEMPLEPGAVAPEVEMLRDLMR